MVYFSMGILFVFSFQEVFIVKVSTLYFSHDGYGVTVGIDIFVATFSVKIFFEIG